MKLIAKYKNGNALVELFDDGTRIIQFDGNLELDYPLNIDIRVNTSCSLGFNPKTGKSVCEYCHETASTNGKECNYEELKSKLIGLPRGIELAIGGNDITSGLDDFLEWCHVMGYVCNLTVNALHIKKYEVILKHYLNFGLINGLGISYRKDHPIDINEFFINHPNVVLHVIAGIDDVDDIVSLPFKKILILGYKKFGRGADYYDIDVENNILEWYWWVQKLIETKDVVSFDNLALEQLNIRRLLLPEKWNEFYQGEHSIYINAVEQYYAPSSRSSLIESWDIMNIQTYFKKNESNNKNT